MIKELRNSRYPLPSPSFSSPIHFRYSKRLIFEKFYPNQYSCFLFSFFLFYRDYFALNVYVALCYYKLDYYDVAQEVLQVYLQKYPDSAIAINLKACNHFRLYNGSAAQSEMKQLIEKMSNSFSFSHDLIRHNAVVRNTQILQIFFPQHAQSSTNLFPFFRSSKVEKVHCKFCPIWWMLYQKPD